MNKKNLFVSLSYIYIALPFLICARLGKMVYFYSGSFFHSLCTLSHAKERL